MSNISPVKSKAVLPVLLILTPTQQAGEVGEIKRLSSTGHSVFAG
jgi:hypothetical protein